MGQIIDEPFSIISNVAPGTSLNLTGHGFVISYLRNLGIKTQMIKHV